MAVRDEGATSTPLIHASALWMCCPMRRSWPSKGVNCKARCPKLQCESGCRHRKPGTYERVIERLVPQVEQLNKRVMRTARSMFSPQPLWSAGLFATSRGSIFRIAGCARGHGAPNPTPPRRRGVSWPTGFHCGPGIRCSIAFHARTWLTRDATFSESRTRVVEFALALSRIEITKGRSA